MKKMLNALTIDVEDYYMVSGFSGFVKFQDWPSYESRVEHTTLQILDMLDVYGVKATFFVLGWVAETRKGLVKEIARRGHEIASHGYNHRLVYDLSPDEFREDLRRSRAVLEDASGMPVLGYRAPSYSVTRRSFWALDILIEQGYRYDSSIFPIHHDRYGYPEFSRFATVITKPEGRILELPMTTLRVAGKNFPIAGGGYLRALPSKFLEWGISSVNMKETQPAIIYFHPWEIDHEQPKFKSCKGLTLFRHSLNIKKTMPKIKRLLERFSFGTVSQVFAKEMLEVGSR